MPKIATYDAPEGLGLRPSEVGISAVAAAARRVQGEYNEAAASKQIIGRMVGQDVEAVGGVAVKYAEHREISAGAMHFASLQDNLQKAWDETAKRSDPNDPSTAGRFREDVVEPALASFKEGFITEGGQRFAENRMEHLRAHMYSKTSADMSGLAAIAQHNNAVQTVNKLSGTVYNDPSSLDFARGTLQASVDGWAGSPNLSATQAAKVRTELMEKGQKQLIHAAISGTIAQGGDWQAIANDKKNAPYIDRAELETFVRAAKAQQRADMLTQKQLEVYQREQANQAVHKDTNQIFSDNVSIGDDGRVVIKPDYFKRSIDLARKYPDAPIAATTAKTLINWGEQQQRERQEPLRDDPEVKAALYDRVTDPNKPALTKIDVLKAEAEGKLSNRSGSILRHLVDEQEKVKEPILNETMHGARAIIGTDPVGAGKFASFYQNFMQEYLAAKRAGTLLPNALDMNDENSMISKAMKPYRRDAYQIIMDKASRGEIIFAPNAQEGGKPPEAMPRPTNEAEYRALKPGTRYIDPNGVVRIKQ